MNIGETGGLGVEPHEALRHAETRTSARQVGVSSSAVSLVSVDSLKTDTSPRLHGVNEEHVSLLVEVGAVLPPILVHRQTMRVIDGVHRLRAAILRGDREIRVRFFDGDEDAAFILSVSANLAHGLPLSLADRRGAAERIIERHPAWSDRAIAKVTGLSADAVANVRRRSTVGNRQLNARVGRDGRVRPLDATAGRIRAGELFAARPEATLREVAREAGIAVGTARDVRDRVQRGVDLVSTGRRVSERHTAAKPPGDARTARDRAAEAAAGVDGLLSILDSLKRDPSLRFTDSGRRLLRWLASHTPRHELDTGLAAAVPPHSATLVAELARRNAVIWQGFAETIEQRSRQVI